MHLKASIRDIGAISELLEDLCGMCLEQDKDYLVESRLGTLVEAWGCANYEELASRAREPYQDVLSQHIVDLMTINETSFFRDSASFAAIQHKLIPEIVDAKEHSGQPNQLRIWSAACSTGQEPYSLAITLSEMLPPNFDIKILATDISDTALTIAREGNYSDFQLDRGMPEAMKARYFSDEGGRYRMIDRIRSMVDFEKGNLNDPAIFNRKFDLILCRNVAIYFSPQARTNLFANLAGCVEPYGALLVGFAENLGDFPQHFKAENHCGATVYFPAGAAQSMS